MTFNPGEKCLTGSQRPMLTERDVKNYTCPVGITRVINGTEFTNSSFNEGKQWMGEGVEVMNLVMSENIFSNWSFSNVSNSF